jgi:hypothetical protein
MTDQQDEGYEKWSNVTLVETDPSGLAHFERRGDSRLA